MCLRVCVDDLKEEMKTICLDMHKCVEIIPDAAFVLCEMPGAVLYVISNYVGLMSELALIISLIAKYNVPQYRV
jgi:hypothetical protein